MERHEYETMARFEATNWWYRGQRSIVLDQLSVLPHGSSGLILDAGCGSGRLSDLVQRTVGGRLFGVDNSPHAAAIWRRHPVGRNRHCLASIDHLPFANETFSLVYSVDVVCCREVDPVAAMSEFRRVLAPGGHLVLVVPAYDWMRSEHDAAVHCVRRFNRRGLRRLLEQAGLSASRLTHLFPSFFPAIAAVRLLRRRTRGRADGGPRSDVRPVPRPLNTLLFGLTQIERRLLRCCDVPFGSSILAVAAKEGAAASSCPGRHN